MRVLLVGAGEQGWESRGPSTLALAGEGVALAGIADPDAVQLHWTADRLGVDATYPSLAEALEADAFDAAILAVPNALHEPLTLEALAAGCHVLCEKPMAVDAAGGRRMLEAAARAGRVLAIGYPYPFMHPVLAGFELGEVLRVEGRWTRRDGIPPSPAFWDRPGSGVADDLLGHLLSVVRVGLAERPVAVTAVGWDRFGREAHGDAFAGHDTFEALIAFAGGPTAHLVAAWASNQDEDETLGVTFAGLERTVDVPLMARATDVAAFRPVVRERGAAPRVLEAVPVQTEECFVVQARNWVAAIRGEEELLFGAEDALAIQGMLDAAKASAAQGGRAVEIEELATVP